MGRAALTEPIELSRRQVKTALDLLLAAIERKPGTIPVVHIPRRLQALDMALARYSAEIEADLAKRP